MGRRSHGKDLSEQEIREMLFLKAIGIRMHLNIILNYLPLEKNRNILDRCLAKNIQRVVLLVLVVEANFHYIFAVDEH